MADQRWYSGITRYQWLILVVASLGWVFDVFEGQIFVAIMKEAMPSLVPGDTTEGQIAFEHHLTVKVTGSKGALWAAWSGATDRTRHPNDPASSP